VAHPRPPPRHRRAPFFLLAATSPLLQAWYARSVAGRSPYRLYAWSNVGSLAALLTYPVAIEPALAVGDQIGGWSLAYGAFAALTALTALASARAPDSLPASAEAAGAGGVSPTPAVRALWLALAACGSTLFLAVTNEITLNIAAVPFLWVLPLSLYLLTFILCFESDRWYRRALFLRLLVFAVAAISLKVTIHSRLWFPYEDRDLPRRVLRVLHDLPWRARAPAAPGRRAHRLLPPVAVGGALGGVFVGLVAPRLFATNLELPIALGGSVLLALLAAAHDPASPLYRLPRRTLALALGALAVILGVAFGSAPQWSTDGSRVVVRNFYGTIRVNDLRPLREGPKRGDAGEAGARPTGSSPTDTSTSTTSGGVGESPYYGPDTGVGLAFLDAARERGRRVGVIGLGVGTLAAFGRPGDVVRFYEINPLVVDLAREQFTYLGDSAARIEVAVGDGRLLLEREPDQNLDLLVVDVFSSDSIPVHILTLEAFELYFRHLVPGGLLALNLSNRYLDLAPIAHGAAAALGHHAVLIRTPEREAEGYLAAEWMLVSAKRERLEDPLIRAAAEALDGTARFWTDGYSNLFSILR
jgi:SAM-dependent methyltransferase